MCEEQRVFNSLWPSAPNSSTYFRMPSVAFVKYLWEGGEDQRDDWLVNSEGKEKGESYSVNIWPVDSFA